MASLGTLLVLVAASVVELAPLAFVSATADAAPMPVTAYVTNLGSNTVTPINLVTNTPGNPIPVGNSRNSPNGIAITPDGATDPGYLVRPPTRYTDFINRYDSRN